MTLNEASHPRRPLARLETVRASRGMFLTVACRGADSVDESDAGSLTKLPEEPVAEGVENFVATSAAGRAPSLGANEPPLKMRKTVSGDVHGIPTPWRTTRPAAGAITV